MPTHMVTSSLHWTLVAMAVWMQLQTSVERISESPSFFKVPPSTCLCLTLHSQVFLITSCYSVFELLWSKCCWWESVIKPCRVTMALSAVYHLAAPLSEYSLTFPVKGLIFILLIVFNEAPALIAPPPMCHKPLYKHGGVLLTPAQRRSSECDKWNMLFLTLTSPTVWFVSLQPENEEKSIMYDNIGANVCMGDHKVTAGLRPHIHSLWFQGLKHQATNIQVSTSKYRNHLENVQLVIWKNVWMRS